MPPQARKKAKEPSRSLFKSLTYGSGALLLDGVNAVTPHWAGAVDVVAVRQPDGSIKSSPFYVRFGKYQSIIRYNRHVTIEVNGHVLPFTMNLGSYGQAYFIREVEEECSDDSEDEALAGMISPTSTYDSGDDSFFKNLQSPVPSGTLQDSEHLLDHNGGAHSGIPGDVAAGKPTAPPRALPPPQHWRSVDRSTRNLPPSTLTASTKRSEAGREGGEMQRGRHSSPFFNSGAGASSDETAGAPRGPDDCGDAAVGAAAPLRPDPFADPNAAPTGRGGHDAAAPPRPERPLDDSEVLVGFGIRQDSADVCVSMSVHTWVEAARQRQARQDDACELRLLANEALGTVGVELRVVQERWSEDVGARHSSAPEALDSSRRTLLESGSRYFSAKMSMSMSQSMSRPNQAATESLLSGSIAAAEAASAAENPAAPGDPAAPQHSSHAPPLPPRPANASGGQQDQLLDRLGDGAAGPPRSQSKPMPRLIKSASGRSDRDSHDHVPLGSSPGAPSRLASASTPHDLLRLFSLSLCGHLLRDSMAPSTVSEIFNQYKLTADAYTDRALEVLESSSLVIRVEDRVYRYADALPIIIALLAFRDSSAWEKLQPAEWWPIDLPQNCKPQVKRSWWPSFWLTSSNDNNGARHPNDGSASSPGTSPQVTQSEITPLKLRTVSTDGVLGQSDDERPTARVRKVALKTSQPTTEQLASMAPFLVGGRNTISFLIGGQRVTCLIFLLEWNIRLVVSDIDGTITRSDVLGHVLPPLGLDWSHAGIVRLFSNITTNGYSFMFLSSRSIAQSSITRNFLDSLKQDVHSMPDGPVIISPHGIIPSLYREMILKRPQEFKIAALQAIKDLFPPDWNPFYAGFGNRDTDEISYLEVGVPASRIFTINPKGMVKQQTAPVQSGTFDSLAKINEQVDMLFPVTQRARISAASVQGEAAAVSAETAPELRQLVDVDEREEFNDAHFWRIPDDRLIGSVDLEADASQGAPVLGLEQRFGKPATTSAVGGPVLGAEVQEALSPSGRKSIGGGAAPSVDGPRCVSDLDKLDPFEVDPVVAAAEDDMASCSSSTGDFSGDTEGGGLGGRPSRPSRDGLGVQPTAINEEDEVFDDAEEDG